MTLAKVTSLLRRHSTILTLSFTLIAGGVLGAFATLELREINAPDVLKIVGTPTINMTSNTTPAPFIEGKCSVNASLQFTCTISSKAAHHGWVMAKILNKSGLVIQASMITTTNGAYVSPFRSSDTTRIGPHSSAQFTFQFQTGEIPEGLVVEFYGHFVSQCIPEEAYGCGR